MHETTPPAPPPAAFHAGRRAALRAAVGDAVVVVSGGQAPVRNRDTHYPFRPDSDFLYLTGFSEEDAVMVLLPESEGNEFILFCQPKDPEQERWNGLRAGLEGACEQYAADRAYPVDEFAKRLPQLAGDRTLLTPDQPRLRERIKEALPKARPGDLAPHLHPLRLIKQPDELVQMRAAAELSALAHCDAMRATRPGRFEYQIQAELEYRFRLGGSAAPAYPSIVAGGANALVLHYQTNHSALADGDLLLIDAGAELGGYAADITRTFPVNGRFSAAQQALYEVVLAAQADACAELAPGKPVNAYHDAAVATLTRGLVDLGLLEGEAEELIETKAYRRFYMHNTGHWLGLDVHDVGGLKVGDEWRVLEPGCVLTVEPGLYIDPAEDIDPKWHNQAIRIEDDALITEEGCEILTDGVPKQPFEIEKLMRG